MADKKPKTVSMRAVKFHTYGTPPVERPPGTVYDVDEEYAESLIALGFAMRETQTADPKPSATSAKPKR